MASWVTRKSALEAAPASPVTTQQSAQQSIAKRFADRTYDLYVFLVPETSPRLWEREVWLAAVPILSPFIDTKRGRASVVSMQNVAGNQREWLKFGALGWNERSHQVWTLAPGDERTFWRTQVYVPGRIASIREGIPPEIYIEIQRPAIKRSNEFDYFVLIAAAADRSNDGLSSAIGQLRLLLKPAVAATTSRPWAQSMGDRTYGAAMDDNFTPLARIATPPPTGLDLLTPMLFNNGGMGPELPSNWKALD